MFKTTFSRRTFLQASLAGILTLCGVDAALAKAVAPDRLPEGTISLYNIHTDERLSVRYRRTDGTYDVDALNALNWLLRCHYTNEETVMDVDTIEYLNRVDKRLGGGNEIHVISGYRSPSYNALLRHNSSHVAKHSLHMVGKAIDIAIPGTPLDRVRHTALALRLGGVGYYPASGFVHIDSGAVRHWG